MPNTQVWIHYICLYGYLAIFLLSVIEGPLVTVFAALLAARGYFNVFAVFATVVAGDLTGDALVYAMGRWILGRLPLCLGVLNQAFEYRIHLLRTDIIRRSAHYLLLGKLTHAVGFAVLLTAGAARIRFTVFVLFNMLGTLPKSGILVLIGYYFGYIYQVLDARYQVLSLIALGLGISISLYLSRRIWTLNPGHHEQEL